MASKRKSPWTDEIRNRQPPAGQSSHSDPSTLPPPAADNPVPMRITTLGANSTTSIPLAPIVASVPQAQYVEESPAISALKTALESLKTKLHELPPLQLSVSGMLEHNIDSQLDEWNCHTLETTSSELTNLATLLKNHVVKSKPRNVPHSIANAARAINEQTQIIKQCQDKSINRKTLTPEDEELVLKCYGQIGVLFRQLQADISMSVWDVQREQQVDGRLRDLSPAHEARYNAALPTTVTKRVGCTKGTRVNLLEDARGWACDPEGPKIHWLNGMAGTGKTTIAYTLCKMLYEDRQLGASFFCSRNSPDCRDVNKIIPTIAYQLGRYSNPYRQTLCSIIEDDPDIAKHDIGVQFEQLISKPLAKVSKAIPADVVVVIDALDECTDVGGTKNMLNLLLRYAANLPIKFFISSRPEPAISNRMTAPGGSMRSILWLHDIEQSLVQADIKTYLTEALESVDVTSDEIDQLVNRAGSLFIFAATTVRYILPDMESVDHRQRLQTVLNLQSNQRSKSYEDIDELYAMILSNVLDEKRLEESEIAERQCTLWTVICAREPLTISALAEITHLSNDQTVQLAIQNMQSVLHVSEGNNVVSALHASFPDFLLNRDRAGRFHCNEALHSDFLAECCFRVMERSLRFNICALDSSHKLDSEVPDLQNRIDKAISIGLFYSCIYWADHLTRASFSDPLLSLFNPFMQHRLLFWLEVLNLKGRLGHGDGVLSQALTWLPVEDRVAELRDSIHDARSFLVTITSNPISLSTPHICISALPFTPKQSYVWTAYWPKTRGLVSVDGAAMNTRGRPVLATWHVGGDVDAIAQSSNGSLVASGSTHFELQANTITDIHGRIGIWDAFRGVCVLGLWRVCEAGATVKSVVFSPDDTRLVSGLSDGTIRIWDATKGDLIAGPLHGHTSTVRSVAFSPDGTRLASGSDDQTIRLWDAYTVASIGEPLKGHQGAVRSVAFSPDGKHLASGSSDCTIRVWDFLAGTTVQGPIEGHTGEVHSIAYSPDGLRLASCSEDRTVRVWDLQNGTILTSAFEGHTEAVNSVSFSPDGTRVVSGSWDKTIRVWEATSGRLLAEPLKGHTGSVNSVLFSRDGTRIISGSSDCTIRVWDPRHGPTRATQSKWRISSIYSISLSPDGTRVASGSVDSAICIWDTRNGTLAAGPFRGHAPEVFSIAFSPDGARIVSGSRDRTLRIWDASTGALLVGPIEGHTGPVRSVAFSPDGNQIASGSADSTIRLWDSHTGGSVTKPFGGDTRWVVSVAFSPDGSRIASGSHLRNPRANPGGHPNQPTVQMWLTSDGSALWKSDAHTGNVLSVAFSPDGMRVVSGSADHTILVLDAGDGAVLYGPFTGHNDQVSSVAFSPDGTRVVSGSEDKTVRVWDVKSGMMVVCPLQGHTNGVASVAFSPGGARIVSGSYDSTIRIWDIATVTHASALSSDNWSIDRDGWLTDSQSQRLFWVPSDLHEGFGFPTPSSPVVMNAKCTTRIEDTTLLGDRWRECYVGSQGSVSP